MIKVHGACPACGARTLFLGSAGHVTCSVTDCPDPGAADDLLEQGGYVHPQVKRLEDRIKLARRALEAA